MTFIESLINNKLIEAKEKLFEDKVNELKSMFDKESLENLKVLHFEFNKNVILLFWQTLKTSPPTPPAPPFVKIFLNVK